MFVMAHADDAFVVDDDLSVPSSLKFSSLWLRRGLEPAAARSVDELTKQGSRRHGRQA